MRFCSEFTAKLSSEKIKKLPTAVRYDTIDEFNVVESKAECDQLKIAHAARKKNKKEETKTNN